jgi:HK97 family phage portal protein
LTLSTWFAVLRNQSEDIGKLPCYVVRHINQTDKQRDDQHPVGRMFAVAPNGYMDPITFRSQMTQFVLGWGNAYAEIERDQFMNPVAMHPIHPSHVEPQWDKSSGRVVYKVQKFDLDKGIVRNHRTVEIDADNIFHLRGMGDDPLVGYSVIRMAAESLSLTLAAERFGASYFKNKGAISGLVTHPAVMDDEARANFTESFNEAYKGARKAGGWILLEDGMKYEQLSITPEDAQFLQTRVLQIEEICRWLRMPPSKIQHLAKANYNSLEMQNLEYTIDSLQPIAIKWEQQAKRKLFRADESDYSLYHNFNGLLRGDIKTQTEHIVKMIQNGTYSPNEARNFLGMNSGGVELDKRFIAVNMVELKPNMVSPNEAKMPRPPSPPKTPPRQGLTRQQAQAVISPAVVRTERKAQRAIERLGKKHAEDNDGLAVAMTELYNTLKEELQCNVLEFWQALGGKDDDAILVIQGGEGEYMNFEEITDKLSGLLSAEDTTNE